MAACVTANVPPMTVLLRFKSFVTVKLVTVVLSNVVIPDTVNEPATEHYPEIVTPATSSAPLRSVAPVTSNAPAIEALS